MTQAPITTDSTKRSLVKTLGYRAAIVITNGAVVYGLTGKMDLAIGVSSATAVLNTAMYYANERLWNKIIWGRIPSKQQNPVHDGHY